MNSGIISVGNNLFEVLLAISAQEQERGLMYIDPPVPNMAFIYETPQINKFWMAHTPSPLDIIFCNAGKITQICYGEPHSTAIIGANEFSDMVVEFSYGTVLDAKIKISQDISLLSPERSELKKIFAQKWR
jgi:uncharacterized membrane protein (UPF0127 family)